MPNAMYVINVLMEMQHLMLIAYNVAKVNFNRNEFNGTSYFS